MTHPATAEGIYQGMRSGMLAAEAVADVVSGRASEREAFRRYEARCWRAFMLSFLGGGLFLRALSTPLLDWLVAAGQLPGIKSVAARLLAGL